MSIPGFAVGDIFVSCRQMMSGLARATYSGNPFFQAARRDATLKVTIVRGFSGWTRFVDVSSCARS